MIWTPLIDLAGLDHPMHISTQDGPWVLHISFGGGKTPLCRLIMIMDCIGSHS